jgi:hypothetical protein
MIILPPREYLLECFHYDPATGRLFWCKRPPSHFKKPSSCKRWNKFYADKEVGCVAKSGYRVTSLNRVHVKVSRIIWKLIGGVDAAGMVDQADGMKQNHKPDNLREANAMQNGSNRKIGSNNQSGLKGVVWRKNRKRWVVNIRYQKTNFFIGMFVNKNDAAVAYNAKALALHGPFVLLNPVDAECS